MESISKFLNKPWIKKRGTNNLPMVLLFSILSVSNYSCTDIGGDGIDTVVWEGATLPEESSYRNPIWEPDLSNPSVFRGATQYYAFGDEKELSSGLNYIVPVLRSSNLMSWTLSGEAFAVKPLWAEGKITSVSAVFAKTLGTYYLAYSIGDAGIGIAYSKAPQGPYVDYGKIVDPAAIGFSTCTKPYFIQSGIKFYLFFNSENGVYGVEMNVVKNAAPSLKGSPVKIAGPDFSGVYIFRKSPDSYYFFGNTGSGESASVKTAKASAILGPYLDKEGNNITNGNGTTLITGNSSSGFESPANVGGIFTDFLNKDWIIYNVKDSKKPMLNTGGERQPLMLDRIDWDEDGWPLTVIQTSGGWHEPKFILTE